MVTRSLLIAVVVALGVLTSRAPAAATSVVIGFDPSAETLMVGEEAVLSIRVGAAAVGLKTYQVAFAYDPSVLEVVEVVEGELLRDSGAPTFFQTLETLDSVVVVASVLGPGIGVHGPGEIFAVRLRARSPGVSQHVFQGVVLLDAEGGSLEADRQAGAWDVQGALDVGGTRPGLWIRAVTPRVGAARIEYAAPVGDRPVLQWFDLQGRLLGRMDLAWGEGSVELPLRTTGIYWVQLRQADQRVRSRIVWIR